MAAMRNTDFDYTGLHAFVFIDHVPENTTPRKLVNRLRKLGSPPDGPVISALETFGAYVAFAHLWREDPNDLGGLLDLISGDLRDEGVRCSYSVEGTTSFVAMVPKGPKRASPEIIGLVSIKCRAGTVDTVLDALQYVPGFRGAASISGKFDILLQLGPDPDVSDDDDDFSGRNGEFRQVMAFAASSQLQGIDGVLTTSTAFADGTR